MIRKIAFILVYAASFLLMVAPTGPVSASTDVVFGPQTCSRTKGAPDVYSFSFPVAEPDRGYVLKVYNGGLGDDVYEKVSSGVITLNGAEVLGPRNFNQRVDYLEAPVSLSAENDLSVEIRGKPGGAMIISICPLIVIDEPIDGCFLRSQPVRVAGHVNSQPGNVSVNGIPAVLNGTSFCVDHVPLNEGPNTLKAEAVSGDGFTGIASIEVILDTVPPAIGSVSPRPGSVIAESRPAVAAEYSDSLSGIDPSSPVILLDGADITLHAQVTGSSIRFQPSSGLDDGAHVVSLTIRDMAGNFRSQVWDFRIDTTPPSVSVTEPPDGSTVEDPVISVSGTIDDDTATVTVNGSAATVAGGVFTAPEIFLQEGPNSITVLARDPVGNSSTTITTVVLVTGEPPSLSFRSPPRQMPDGRDLVEISVSVSDPDGDGCRLKVEYSLDGAAWARATLSREGFRVGYTGPGVLPEIDNTAARQIGEMSPIPTDSGPNQVTFLWNTPADLPSSDNLEAYLRLTVNDQAHNVALTLPLASWAGIGHALTGGGLSETPGDSYAPSLAVNSLGSPHVAWIETTAAGDAVAYLRWDGHEWVDADGTGREGMIVHQTSTYVWPVSLALDQSGKPRIAWVSDEGGNNAVYYLAWDGVRWVDSFGQAGHPAPAVEMPGLIDHVVLRIDNDCRSHLMFTDRLGSEGGVNYLTLVGKKWVDSSGRDRNNVRIGTATSWRGADLVLDNMGRPHIAWLGLASEVDCPIHHLYLDNHAWRSKGDDGNSVVSIGNYSLPSLALGTSNEPHLFWVEYFLGNAAIRHSRWTGSTWESPVKATHDGTSFPSAMMLSGDIPAVAFLDYSTGTWTPELVVGGTGWSPWPGLTEAVSPGARDAYALSGAITRDGRPLVAFDDYNGQTEEIYCASIMAGSVVLDTAAPSPPGAPSITSPPISNEVTLTFGSPAADDHFFTYIVEASPNINFSPVARAWDLHHDPCLGFLDYGGMADMAVKGLDWGQTLYFRITAVDRAGHRSSSPPGEAVTIPEDRVAPSLVVEYPPRNAVLPDSSVILSGTTDDPQATLSVNGQPVELFETYFQCPVTLAEGDNELVVTAVDRAGNERRETIPVVCIPLEITSPPSGSSVMGMFTELTGSCGTTVFWIEADGRQVPPVDGRFLISPFYVEEGEQSYSIKAFDDRGRFSERQLTLYGLGDDLSVTLNADPPAGAAPVDVTLSCNAGEIAQEALFSWDADGDGRPEQEGEGLVSVSQRYQEAGTYYPNVLVTDPGGVRYRAAAMVTIHAPPRVVASIPVVSPGGVAVDGDGFLFVSEQGANAVKVFDPDLQPYRIITGEASGESLNSPGGLAIDELGYLWVCDTGNNQMAAFDREGRYHGRWPVELPLQHVSHDGSLFYASAESSNLVYRFKREINGDALGISAEAYINLSPENLGGIAHPEGITMDNGGRIYVSDPAGNRILGYVDTDDPARGFVNYIRPLIPSLPAPSALSLCRQLGVLAVIEKEAGRIRLFSEEGALETILGPEAFGGTPLLSPSAVAMRQVREGTLIYAADTGNNRVVILLLPGEDPLKPIEDLISGLQAGDVEAVAASFHEMNKADNLAFIEEIKDKLPQAASYFENVELVSLEGNMARCRNVRNCTIGEMTADFEFEIILLKDQMGKWKILDF